MAGFLVVGVSSAQAGTYEVRACHDTVNNSWASYRSDASSDAYAQCPGGFSGGDGLIARNTGGAANAPIYSQAMMYFDAPPGAAVVRVRGNFKMKAVGGWHAGIHDMSSRRWVLCGSTCTDTLGAWFPFDIGGLGTSRIAALVVCASSCRRDALHGFMAMSHVTVTLEENGAPGVAIAGGSVVQGGWRRGLQDVLVEAWDFIGTRRTEVSVDGGSPTSRFNACDDTRAVPCPNGTYTHLVNTRILEDGAHDFRVTAVDSAENRASRDTTIYVDNTGPSSPRALATARGGAWQARNEFTLRWDNPPQSAAPIAGATLAVCPVGQPDLELGGCPTVTRYSGRDLDQIHNIEVPRPGQWTARLWLRDAAGNELMDSAAETTLRFDDVPPELTLEPPSVDRPAELRVTARDTVSGLAAGEIELQRVGTSTWTTLPGRLDDKGFSAMVDDEALADGNYRVRARAVDHAGNERSTDRRAGGDPLTLTLPLRVTSRLVAGRPKRVRARGSKRYRIVLVARPQSRYGRTIPLSGRLTTPGANPLPGREIEVFELSTVPGAAWRRIATVATSRTGRFVFKALRGPSRTLRFRYPGTETIRGRSVEVNLRVRAATSMRSNRRNVVNGEEVTFRGRLKGQPIPPGKLVELQAYSRGHWLTFATPRANQRTGLWSHRYRFAATRGTVRYRFRARVPRETGYPYETGTSATIRVSVRGL